MSRCDVIRAERGFTYLWVLMATALLGLGLAAAATVLSTAVQRDKERELIAIGHQFRAAIARYRETRNGAGMQEYPVSLEDLLQDRRFPDTRRYLRKQFVDPMTGRDEWGLVRVAGRIVGVHSMSERLPIKQDRFEPEDAALRGKPKYSEWVFTYPSDLLVLRAGESPTRTDAEVRPAPVAPAASAASAP
jgi:type II secretory pathway pseudopilin PulG